METNALRFRKLRECFCVQKNDHTVAPDRGDSDPVATSVTERTTRSLHEFADWSIAKRLVSWHSFPMRLSFVFLVAVNFLVTESFLNAEEQTRFVVVDLEAIFAAHPTTADATASLTKAREASRDEFKQRSNELKEILQKHQELIRAGNKDAAAEKLIEANEAEKRIATLRTTRLRDLEEEFQRTKTLILSEIQEGIAAFNQEGKYAMIFDRSSKSNNGLPQVLHAPGVEDITEKVITFLKTYDPDAASAP